MSGITLLEADDRYVDVAGDSMTGNLVMIDSNITLNSGSVFIGSGLTLSIGNFVNEVTTIVDINSTNEQLPTAKAVWNADQLAIQSAVTYATSGLNDLYVNVDGDTMTGDLTMNSSSIFIDSGLTLSNDWFVKSLQHFFQFFIVVFEEMRTNAVRRKCPDSHTKFC